MKGNRLYTGRITRFWDTLDSLLRSSAPESALPHVSTPAGLPHRGAVDISLPPLATASTKVPSHIDTGCLSAIILTRWLYCEMIIVRRKRQDYSESKAYISYSCDWLRAWG